VGQSFVIFFSFLAFPFFFFPLFSCPFPLSVSFPICGWSGKHYITASCLWFLPLSLFYYFARVCYLADVWLCSVVSGADLKFYKGGCPIHLKGVPEVLHRRRRGGGVWRGACAPCQKIFGVFLISKWWVLCIPGDIYWHCNCKPLREKTLAFKLQKINNCAFVGFMLIICAYVKVWNEQLGLAIYI